MRLNAGFRVKTGGVAASLLCSMAAACNPVPSRPPTAAPARSMQGSVDVQDMGADDTQRYAASANFKYVQALGYPENAMPVYPRDLLALRLPEVVVHARVVVDASGHVVDVLAVDGRDLGAKQARFFDAIRKACSGWRYSPLLRLDLSTGPVTVQEDEATVTYEGRPTALPFHLDYAFRFMQRDGVPDVGANDASKPR